MRVVAFSLFLLLSVVCAPAMSQTAPLEEKQKAVMVLDIRMDAIRDSKLAKELKLADKITAMHAQSGDDGPNPATIDRVLFAMSAPEDMQSAMSIQMGQMPMDFYVKMTFNDEAAVTEMVEKAKEEEAETAEYDGKTFYKLPENPGAPVGVMIRQVDAKTVEAGTETFLFRPDRNVFTDNLSAVAKNAPKGAIRLAMDLSGAKGLIKELVEMGKQQAPDPTVGVYMDLIDNMQDIAISLDVSGGDLLSVKATGVNQADTVELKEGLDSLLGLAKMSIKGVLPMIREQDPAGAGVMEQLSKSLNATNTDSEVTITIPTPEGFNDWVVQQVSQLEQMGIFGG